MTKFTDYGMILLMQIACEEPGAVFTARSLSSATYVPQPMVSKILKSLAGDDLLISHRGVHGGYQLARPAQEITVAEIIGALEGPIALTECIGETPSNCEIERLCPVKSNWEKINNAVRGALEAISLAEMAEPLLRHRVVVAAPLSAATPGTAPEPVTTSERETT